MDLREIGQHVRERREALGLSQDRLAKFAGLSRATINQLETGTLPELGVSKLGQLLTVIGLDLQAVARPAGRRKAVRPLLAASRSASVSYRSAIEPGQLAQALASGEVPDEWLPHVATLLDEAPLPLVVSAVEEAALRRHMPAQRVWRHVTKLARRLQSPRRAWR